MAILNVKYGIRPSYHGHIKRYLNEIIQNKLIECKGGKYYYITDKGEGFLYL